MKQTLLILFASALFLVNGVLLWADPNNLYETVVIDTFDGAGTSKYPMGSEMNVLQEDGSTQILDISGQDVVWYVDSSLASRYATEGFPKSKYVNTWPIDLFGVRPNDADAKQVYGIQSKFDRQGYNYFAIYAGAQMEEGQWRAQSLPLSANDRPAKIKNLNIWVWGVGYEYTLELHVRDFRSVAHVLPMQVVSGADRNEYRRGSLLFTGWRKMSANISNSIPQDSRYGQDDYRLHFVKFVVRTHPYERVDNFYIYFDHMQVTIDPHSNFYDGRELSRPDRILEIWGNGNNDEQAQDAAAAQEAQ